MSYTKTFVKAKVVDNILDLSVKTVYNGGAGTHTLTRVPSGNRGVRFILQEAEALKERQLRRAA